MRCLLCLDTIDRPGICRGCRDTVQRTEVAAVERLAFARERAGLVRQLVRAAFIVPIVQRETGAA